MKENRGQGVISRRQLKKLKWCGYSKREEKKAAYPKERKAE